MHSYLSRDLANERQNRLLAEAQCARLAARASSAATDRRAPHVAFRAVGKLLVALGSRLGGAIPTPPTLAEPTGPAPAGHVTSATAP
ncbi:MAG: hypothetical protein ACRDJH_19050 [Thermomicrobiales bacterium]